VTKSKPAEPRRGTLGTNAPLIGLIGPIGSGKSTVAGWLTDRGAVVVDADLLTRSLMTPGTPVTEAIVNHFGEKFRHRDGSLDRGKLGRLVFADPVLLAELEAIVHPAIGGVLEASIRAADMSRPRAIVLEAIKLVEAGHAPWCDEVWLVNCSQATQLARLVGRGMSMKDARQRIAAQAASLPLWRESATRVIDSDGSRAEVEAAVDAALVSVRSQFSGPGGGVEPEVPKRRGAESPKAPAHATRAGAGRSESGRK
jgi:dephospho-CoA kinase